MISCLKSSDSWHFSIHVWHMNIKGCVTFLKEQQQPFPLSPMQKRIVLLNNHIAVQSVSRNSHFLMIWRNMKELMVQNLSGAYSVIRDSHCLMYWNSTRELVMLVKNHLTAQSVTRNLHLAVTWKNMKELTLMNSYSVAYNVTRNSNTLVLWNNTKNSCWWRTFQLFTMW